MLTPEDLGLGFPFISSVTQKNGNRTYSVPGHKTNYPSVTTLISHFEPKYGLNTWIENMGEEESRKITKRCAAVGTKVHKCNESFFDHQQYSINEDPEHFDEVLTRHRLFLPLLQKIQPLMIEQKLYWSRFIGLGSMGFGGTADLVASFHSAVENLFFTDKERTNSFSFDINVPFVADYKNFLKAKQPDRLIGKYLQAAAYSLAVEQRTGGRLNPKHGFIFATTKTQLTCFHINPECMAWYRYWYIKLVEAYFNKTKFDWKTFNEFSCGYQLNPNENWKEDGENKWIDREENYLATKLFTPKVNKKQLSLLQTPYLTF